MRHVSGHASPRIRKNLKKFSPQKLKDIQAFGPIYHGSPDNDKILETGKFQIVIPGKNPEIQSRHGYKCVPYLGSRSNFPPPMHHLGFGVYFTTNKSIAKRFNRDSIRGLKKFFLPNARILTINFAAPSTMMAWWLKNGYNPKPFGEITPKQWHKATAALTQHLSRDYDAIWFKGKTIYSQLDGDQICVYRPNLIAIEDKTLVKGLEIGATVTYQPSDDPELKTRCVFEPQAETKGIITETRNMGNIILPNYPNRKFFTVKWKKGGIQLYYLDCHLKLVSK